MPPKRQAQICLDFRSVFRASVICLLTAVSIRAANITNTGSLSAGWGTATNSWNYTAVATPWDSVNGATNTAVLTYTGGNFVITNSGVWANGITLNPTFVTGLSISGGNITFSGSNPAINVTQSNSRLTFSNSFAVSGNQTITVAGSGTVSIAGSNTFSGNISYTGGVLAVTNTGWMGNATVTVGSSSNRTFSGGGRFGSIRALTSPGNTTPNAVLSNCTVLGQLLLTGTTNGSPVVQTTFNFGANYPAGYATANTGTVATNVVVNGRLDIIGSGSMSLSGVTGSSNGITTNAAVPGFNGSGILVSSNFWTNGGAGNTITMADGRNDFAEFYVAQNSVLTLAQSGSATTSFALFGYPQTNATVTLSGGTWLLGRIGQNNSSCMNLLTNTIAGNAAVTVSNAGYDGGVWNITQGSLAMVGNVQQKNSPQQGIQFNVGGSGTFTTTGNLRLGNSWYSSAAGYTNRLLVNGGSAVIGGNLLLGYAVNASNPTITFDTSLVSVTNGGILSVRGNLTVGDQGTGNSSCLQRVLLSGGELLVAQSLNAASIATTSTNGLLWTGGILSAYTINTTNVGWSDSSSSIQNGLLSNSAGTLAPGDTGIAGLTTIQGNYVQGGSGTLAIDLGGTIPASLFQHTNAGFSDQVAVTGSATLGGSLSVSLCQGYSPLASDVLTILTASSGITGSFTNVAFDRSVSVDGTNGFLVTMSGNSVRLSSFHRIGPPVITTQPVTQTAGLGGQVTLSVGANSPIPATYQWRFNSNPISGATNPTLTLLNLQSNNVGSYDVILSNADGITNSSVAVLSVLKIASVALQPSTMMIPTGGTATFSVSATAQLPISYQWRFNGSVIASATNSSYAVSSAQAANAGAYDVVMTTADGSVTSDQVNLVLLSTPLVTLTNTNSSWLWGGGSTNWSTSPVTNPFSPANGAFTTVILTNSSGSLRVDPSGVTVNGLNFSGVLAGSPMRGMAGGALTIAGGPVAFAGTNASILVGDPSAPGTSLTIVGGGLSGSGSITKTGNGALILNGPGTFAGNMILSAGSLQMGPLASYGSMSVTLMKGVTFNATGILGGLYVGGNGYGTAYSTGSGSAGSINATASDATFLGSVIIVGPDATKMAYATANMPTGSVGTNYGYARFGNGVVTTNLLVNGRLDLIGNDSMTLSGINGTSNGQTNWIGGGSGAIVNSSIYSVTNALGGTGNILSFTPGAVFSGFYFATNAYATLTQSGNGTVSFGIFGQPAGNTQVFSNSQTTFSGGTWRLGQLGQGNSWQIAGGTFVVTNGAILNVGGNTGASGPSCTHGNYLISQGQMNFSSTVAEGGGGNGALINALQFTVESAGTLTVNGTLQLGVNGVAGTVLSPSLLTLNGGLASATSLILGNANGTTAVINDIITTTVNGGLLSVGSGGIMVGYSSSSSVVSNEIASLILNGGEILCSGSLNAPTSLHSNSTITSSFVWNGGQLSVSQITASNTNWDGSDSSILNGQLSNTNGVLAPGDTGNGGLTAISGSYAQSAGGVLEIDLGGSTQASAFQSGTNTYDTVSMTGTARLGGQLRVRVASGFVPSGSQTLTILSASGGVTGSFANLFATNRIISSDGKSSFRLSTNGTNLVLSGYSMVVPPVIVSAPVELAVVSGGSGTLSVTATSSVLPLTYQWRRNGAEIAGETNSSLVLSGIQSSDAAVYDVVVSNPQSFTNSAPVNVGLIPPPRFSSLPITTNVVAGLPVTLSSSVLSSLPMTYQWTRNGTDIAGATNALLTLANPAPGDSGIYVLRASNANGTVLSPSTTLTVLPLTAGGLSGNSLFAGGSATLSVEVSSSTSVSYQWKKNGISLPGATNAMLVISNALIGDTGSYSVTLSNSLGSTTTASAAVLVARPYVDPTVAFYPMDAFPVSGTGMVPDETGNTVGTLTGSSTNPLLLTNQPLPGGNAWSFTNTEAYVSIPNRSSGPLNALGNVISTPGMSVAFWVKYDYPGPKDGDNRAIIDIGSQATFYAATGHTAGLHKGIINLSFGNNNNIAQIVMPTPARSTSDNALNDTWHHVVATLDYNLPSNNAILYVDGSLAIDQYNQPVVMSQPINASFNSSANSAIGARVNGSYRFKANLAMVGFYTRALGAGEVAQLYNGTSIADFAPTLSVLADASLIEWPLNRVGLQGIASDDGLPGGGISYKWSQVTGPGLASFDSKTNPVTSATFSQPGAYTLRLTANDGYLSDFHDITVNVSANTAPVVYVGTTNSTVKGGETVNLSGGAIDDGLPMSGGGFLTYSWTQVSGPASAVISSPASNNTSVTMPSTPGNYLFRLLASDGYQTGSNSVAITVTARRAPVVTASALTPVVDILSTNSIALTGSAVLDGGVTSSFTWSQVSGATASFASPGSSNTTLTLPSAGVYQLRLTVSDGTSSSSSDVWVSAWSGSRGMLPPGILSTNAQPTNRVLDLGSAVPPPYVHPRIFFSEADRSSLRSATNDPLNPAVTNAIALLRSAVSKSIDNPSSPVGIAYQRLKTGDATWDIRGIVSAQNGPYETLIGNEKCGLYGPLASACYLAWLDQDNPAFQQRLKDLATAVATAARQHTTWYVSDRMEKANTTTNPNAYDPNSYDVYSDLAFCYDLMYNWMTEDQRGTTRSLLTWMTAGRLTLKAGGEPDYAHSTNHRIFHDHLIIAQLAIEGETGWDPSAIASNFLSKKIYYSVWGLTPDGFSREAPGYWVFGMHNGAPAAYALSKRYENLFATTHLYASMQELFYQMSPDETGKMYGTHDGCGWGNGGGSSTYYPIMKAVYPTDPYIDYVARKCWQNGGYNGMPLVVAIFGRPFLTPHTTFRDVAASKSMPQTIFSPQRGMGVARSDWSTNALQLDLDTRGDCMSLTHLHSSRNSFTLYALGREWFMGQGYHLTENDSKQTILIDNLGAASTSVTTATNSWFGSNAPSKWPSMPGRIVEVVDQPRIALFAGDAAPVYTYSWANIDFCEPSKSTSNLANSIVTPYRWRDMFYPGMTYPTPVVGDNSWLDNFILADSTLYNPVSKAFRTIMLVRGSDPVTATYPRSYSLILDDIQKTDTNTHTFVWSGNTLPCYPYNANPDTSLLSVSSNSAVMYHSNEPAAERPQLYVGIAAANGSGTITMDDTPLDNGEGPMPANRLLISRSNTVAPDFKILLYPHLNGEPLPTTSYTQIVTNGTTNGTLTVNLPNGSGGFVSDVFNLRVQQDGRTRVTGYARGGVVPPTIAVPANIMARTAGSNAPVGFTVTARDASGNTLTPSINPAPGSLFPTGTTVVNVSASDASGNMSSASFNVTVTPVDPPSPWTLTQVGLVTTGTAGSATYDTNSATFSLIGRGGVMSSAEAFTLLSQPWTNNGVFTARVRDLATKDLDGMAFLTARVSTNAGVVGAHVSVNGRGAVGFSTRSTANVSFSTTSSNGLSTPCWLRLVRSGTNVLGFTSPDGILWTQLGSSFSLGIATNTPFQIGLGASPDTAGYSAYATFDNVSLVGVPASVTGFAASNASSNVTLSWNPVTGAQGYLVGRSGASNGTFTNLAASGSAVNFRDVPPLPGVSYFYRVSATNVAGSSSPAGPVMGGLVAGVPTGLQAIPGSGRISLAWSSAASASAYTVKRSSSAGGPYSALASGLTNTAYTDTGVTAGNTYFYVVSATNGLGEGAPSLEVSETALNAIQAWRLAKFGTSDNSGLASDTANPSGDGIPNLMKYALGLDPLSTNAAARPLAILTNGYLQMTFSRTNDPVLVYSVEGTADFTAWTNIWSSTGASNVPGPVTVRDSNAPSSSTTRRFLRLRVTAP
jgi:autotransporter-associated beta strand protein